MRTPIGVREPDGQDGRSGATFRSKSAKIEAVRAKRYDNQAYRAARARSPHVLPEPDLGDTTAWSVDFLIRRHMIPPPPLAAPSGRG